LGGFGIAFLSAICFSTKAVFAKLAYLEGAEALGLLFWRMTFALPFFLFVLFRNSKRINISFKTGLHIFFLGALGYYASSFFDFKGLEYLDASVARLIIFIYPTMVVIGTAIFYKERISKQVLLTIAGTYIGLILVFSKALSGGFKFDIQFVTGSIWELVAAMTFATYMMGTQLMIRKTGPVQFASMAMIVAAGCVMSHTLIDYGTIPIYNYKALIYIFCMSMIATVAPVYLVAMAIEKIGASKVSLISSVGPVATIILSFIILGESLTPLQITGGLIIILSVVLLKRIKRK